jgi:hypothetical protein
MAALKISYASIDATILLLGFLRGFKQAFSPGKTN